MTEALATGIGTCQVCGDVMHDGIHRCAACDTPHHAVCWEYLGGCSTYACSAGARPLVVMNSNREIQVVLDPGRYVNPGTLTVQGPVAAFTPAGAKAPLLPGDRAFEMPLALLTTLRAGRDLSRLFSISMTMFGIVVASVLFTGGVGLPIGIGLSTIYGVIQAFRHPTDPEGVTTAWLARDARGALQLLMVGGPGFEPLRLPARVEFQLVLSRTPANRAHPERAWLNLEAKLPPGEDDAGPPSCTLLPPVSITGEKGHVDGEQRALGGLRKLAQTVGTHLGLAVVER